MKTLLTPTPLIAVEIQEHENTVIWANKLTLWEGDNFKEPIVFSCRKIEILGTVDKGVIDFEVEEYLAVNPNYIEKHYMSFNHDGMYKNKNKAFLSLLTFHSLSLDKKYLIIKSKN